MLQGYADRVTLTYGDRLLAEAEARAHSAMVRRRMLALGVPALLATFASTAGLYRAQLEWIDATGASALRRAGTHALMIASTVTFVCIPLLGAIRSRRIVPAMIALSAGPILTPQLFGPGGWRWWQTLVVVAVCVLVSAAALRRRVARVTGRWAAT